MQIHIQKQSSLADDINIAGVENAAVTTLLHQKVGDNATISIVLVDDSPMQELNKVYRGVDKPTDVLSFPMEYDDPDDQSHYFGDVIISMQTAITQAIDAGHPVESELTLLVVHGILHLLGFDHTNDEEKVLMWTEQSEILKKLGIKNIELEPNDE